MLWACISRIKTEWNGKRKNCDIYSIKKIKNIKKCTLNKNIKKLEELSKVIKQSINELKIIFEKINKNEEELKKSVQAIITKLRNEINEREDKIFVDIEKKFEELFFNEKLIKEREKLPNKIKINLEKGKMDENERNTQKNGVH